MKLFKCGVKTPYSKAVFRMQLPYLNALNLLTSAIPGRLTQIADYFHDDFAFAWQSRELQKFLPPAAPYKSVDPEKEWEKVLKAEIILITLRDKKYPRLLKHIAQPPYLLYLWGKPEVLKTKSLGIVGTRRPTEYGRRAATYISEDVAASGFTIVSGLAMGIDGLAHRAALKNQTPTVAVLGGGLLMENVVSENKSLVKEIVRGGAVISEFGLNINGSKQSFPQRNRIISGLSKGVVIIEADEKSGSLITAKHALDQNRDVFAVPGPIFSPRSQGPNNLLKLGAKVVTSAEDILTEYNIQGNLFKPSRQPANELEKKIMEILKEGALNLDILIRTLQKPTPEVASCLMNMELENKVQNLGNNRFCLPS